MLSKIKYLWWLWFGKRGVYINGVKCWPVETPPKINITKEVTKIEITTYHGFGSESITTYHGFGSSKYNGFGI